MRTTRISADRTGTLGVTIRNDSRASPALPLRPTVLWVRARSRFWSQSATAVRNHPGGARDEDVLSIRMAARRQHEYAFSKARRQHDARWARGRIRDTDRVRRGGDPSLPCDGTRNEARGREGLASLERRLRRPPANPEENTPTVGVDRGSWATCPTQNLGVPPSVTAAMPSAAARLRATTPACAPPRPASIHWPPSEVDAERPPPRVIDVGDRADVHHDDRA